MREIGEDNVRGITSRHSTTHSINSLTPPARHEDGHRSKKEVTPVKSEEISCTHTPLEHIPSFIPHPFTAGHSAKHSPVRHNEVPAGHMITSIGLTLQRSADVWHDPSWQRTGHSEGQAGSGGQAPSTRHSPFQHVVRGTSSPNSSPNS